LSRRRSRSRGSSALTHVAEISSIVTTVKFRPFFGGGSGTASRVVNLSAEPDRATRLSTERMPGARRRPARPGGTGAARSATRSTASSYAVHIVECT
jgi:hypothetical protein